MTTGPITLFDKSFLQSLSQDESVWFDHFFYTVICPVFYIETLADLAKAPRDDRTAEAEVRIIASKFPEMSGTPCVNHAELCVSELLGASLPMDGRIPRPGGRRVKGGNRSGVVYESSAEEAAFHRWQEEKFQEVERQFAGQWRAQLNALDLDALAKSLQSFGGDKSQCKTFEVAAAIARGIVEGTDRPYTRLGFAVNFFKVPNHLHQQVIDRWQAVGQPPLATYAPYAAYVLTVDIFFYTALAAGLISTERRSNRTDIAYLYYLPFCMMFVSSDKLHARCAGLFCRKDQNFVWGPDLKADLRRLNEHYLALPEADRDRGIMQFAGHPPNEGNYLTTKL